MAEGDGWEMLSWGYSTPCFYAIFRIDDASYLRGIISR
jgi:hypothetical protein